MIDLPHLQEIYEGLCTGHHFGPDDGEPFDALRKRFDEYHDLFAALGLNLVRKEPEFFYIDAPTADAARKTSAKMTLVCFILVDHYASQNQSIEEAVMGHSHLVRNLPHFALDRYAKLMREVDIPDRDSLEGVLESMAKIGWLKWEDHEQFRFLRPFYRIFAKCIELAETAATEKAAERHERPEGEEP